MELGGFIGFQTSWVNPRRVFSEEVLESGKAITITSTPGRSGTGFLQRVFALFPNFHSEHEPDIPQLKSHPRWVARNSKFSRNVWR